MVADTELMLPNDPTDNCLLFPTADVPDAKAADRGLCVDVASDGDNAAADSGFCAIKLARDVGDCADAAVSNGCADDEASVGLTQAEPVIRSKVTLEEMIAEDGPAC